MKILFLFSFSGVDWYLKKLLLFFCLLWFVAVIEICGIGQF
jgi:hypothetical protein